jgi:hypothetical protein
MGGTEDKHGGGGQSSHDIPIEPVDICAVVLAQPASITVHVAISQLTLLTEMLLYGLDNFALWGYNWIVFANLLPCSPSAARRSRRFLNRFSGPRTAT